MEVGSGWKFGAEAASRNAARGVQPRKALLHDRARLLGGEGRTGHSTGRDREEWGRGWVEDDVSLCGCESVSAGGRVRLGLMI